MKLKELLRHFDRPETRIAVGCEKYYECYGEFFEFLYQGDVSKIKPELLERKVMIWHVDKVNYVANGMLLWVKVK